MNTVYKFDVKKFVTFIALTFLSTVIIVLLNWRIYTQSVPRLDEIAFNAFVFRPWTEWFTSGLSNFFNPYLELSDKTTNFIRPIINVFYWAFWKFNISYPNQLIIFCYSIHGMIVAVVFLALSRQSQRDAVFAATAMFFAGSFWPIGLNYPIYGSEFLAALLSGLAILSLLKGFRIAAIVLLLSSILTKETSLSVAAGLVVVTFLIRDYKTSSWAALLIAGYFLNRYLSFESLIGGIYAPPTLTFKSFLTVFTFPISYGSLTLFKNSILDREPAGIQLFVFLNIVILSIVLKLIYVQRKACVAILTKVRSGLSEHEKSFVIVLFCFVASLAYYVFIARVARFSYQTLVFFFLTLSLLPLEGVRRRMILITLLGNILGFGQAYTYFTKQYDVEMLHIEAINGLRDNILNLNSQARIYTVNDPVTGYSKPSDFAFIHGSKIDLQKGSSLEIIDCPFDELKRITASIETVGREKTITTTLPPCAKFVFEGASREKMRQFIQGDWIMRNAQIAYQILSDDPAFSLADFLQTKESFPEKMIVRVRDSSVLYFDYQAQDWRFIE